MINWQKVLSLSVLVIVKFSLQTILAITVVAVLIAAILGERHKTAELKARIASTESWLDSFNHHSVECLPYYRKALAWKDPILPFSKRLVSDVEQQQKRIESMPRCDKTDVSVVEVATMDHFRYVYAANVPVGKTAKAEFFSAVMRSDWLNTHIKEAAPLFAQPLSIELPVGLSKLEVIQGAIEERSKLQSEVVFVDSTPTIEIRLNGNSIFEGSVSKYRNVGSHPGWKPDAKKQLVLNSSGPSYEFGTFSFSEKVNSFMTAGPDRRGKSFRIKFRLTSGETSANGVADE